MWNVYYAFQKALVLFGVARKQHRQILVLSSYLAAIEGSVGSRQYRNLYIRSSGKDVLEGGIYACAWFVSTLLVQFRLIGATHATVDSTIKDLRHSGWLKDSKVFPRPGAVLVWEAIQLPDDDRPHRHIGFHIGSDLAVSMDYKKGCPVEHNMLFHSPFKEMRGIELSFWNPMFDA